MKAVRTLGICLVAAVGACDEGASKGGTSSLEWFVEEADARGIDFSHVSGFTAGARLPEIVGGGAALVDVDGDGDLDAYLIQSGSGLGEEGGGGTESAAERNRLYLNSGDGRFREARDIGDAADPGYGMGVAAGDYDNDGDTDLYVTNLGPNVLLRNDGSGRFENVATAAGVADPSWSTAALFADLDGDGDLDLFVVNYLNWSPAVEKDCYHRGNPTYCAPTAYDSPAMDRLYRNDGDGTFTDVTVKARMNTGFGNGLGAVAADFNGDGMDDIFVANDRLVDQLWINRGDLRFDDEAENWGCAVDDNGVAKAGMGVAAADLDRDGDEDLLVVNFEGETDSLYRNEGDYFVDVTNRTGIAAASRRRTRFGVAFADFDNDAVYDLYEVNGKVDGDPAAVPDVFAEPNTLFRGTWQEDRFRLEEEPGAGVAAIRDYTSRALAVGDVDGDGGLDMLVVNRDDRAQLFMNRVEDRGNWVSLRVLDDHGRDAFGAVVTLEAGEVRFRQTVRSAASYLASHDPRAHFGLGAETRVNDVEVRWPGGSVEAFGSLPSGATVVLRRGAGDER